MTEYTSDRQINQLEAGTAIQNSDYLVLWTSQGTVRVTASQLAAYIAQGVPNPPALPALCLVERTTDYAWSASFDQVPWQTVSGTASSAWNPAQPTRLTTPAGYTAVRFTANHRFNDYSAAARYNLLIRKEGVDIPGACYAGLPRDAAGGSPNRMNVISSIIPTTPGEWFELGVFCSLSGGRDTLAGTQTWLQAEYFN